MSGKEGAHGIDQEATKAIIDIFDYVEKTPKPDIGVLDEAIKNLKLHPNYKNLEYKELFDPRTSYSLLHYAHTAEMVNYLLQKGISPNISSQRKQGEQFFITPLQAYARRKPKDSIQEVDYREAIQALLSPEEPESVSQAIGELPKPEKPESISQAIGELPKPEKPESVAERTNVDLCDHKGWTALHHAMVYGCQVAVNALLDKGGANVNAQNGDGETPLHLAVIWNHPDAVSKLLEHGAQKDIKDHHGRMAADHLNGISSQRILTLFGIEADNNASKNIEVVTTSAEKNTEKANSSAYNTSLTIGNPDQSVVDNSGDNEDPVVNAS